MFDGQDLTPDTSILFSMQSQNLTWPVVLKELIDNALDASATCIRLTLSRTVVRIEDNGRGCADLLNMLTLGKRQEYDETQIGKYGIGAKDAMLWIGQRVRIMSICHGIRREVAIDWKTLQANKIWRLSRPIQEQPSDEPSQTVIEITGIYHRSPLKQRLLEDFGRSYLPALQHGCQLLVKYYQDPSFLPIEPFILPQLLQEQQERIIIDGKIADVTLGIVPEGLIIPYRGFMCLYGPRVIVHQKRLGIPQDVTNELFGWIVFEPSWQLDKNKLDFLDDLDPLAAEIERRFVGLFQTAEIRRKARPSDHAVADVNAELGHIPLGGEPRKARRPGPHRKTGTVQPTGTGSPHTQAQEDQPGKTFLKYQKYRVALSPLGNPGPFYQLAGDVIMVNEQRPYIQEALENEPLLKERLRWAVACVLMSLKEGPQLKLFWDATFDPTERLFLTVETLGAMKEIHRHKESTP